MNDLQVLLDAANEIKPYIEPYLPTLVRWGMPSALSIVKALWRKYRDDPPATQKAAVENFADASRRISTALDEIIESGDMTEEEVRTRIEQPDFIKSLQRLLLEASETDDVISHEAIGRLIAARIAAPALSRKNLLLRRAAATVRDLTGRQIRLLGLIYALFDVGTDEDTRKWQMPQFLEWVSTVEQVLNPFNDVVFDDFDLEHLQQMGATQFHRLALFGNDEVAGYSRLLAPLNIAWQSLPPDAARKPNVVRAMDLMRSEPKEGRRGFESLTLTPVGRILGACAYSISCGDPFLSGDGWDEP